MHKLMENVEKELHAIAEKGLNTGNLNTAYTLIDMYKDLKEVESMGYGATESREMPVMRRDGYRFDRNLNELYDAYCRAKAAYKTNGDQMHREKVTKSLEALMSEICDLMFDIHRDCDFREERDIIMNHMDGIKDMK